MPLPRSTALMPPAVAASRMHAFRVRNPDVKAIVAHLHLSDFKALKGKTGYFGARELLRSEPGESGSITAYAQEYVRQNSPDRAIFIVATLTVGKRKETVTFGAIAPQGEFKSANGFEASSGDIVFTHSKSLWQCVWKTFVVDSGPARAETVSSGGVNSLRTCSGAFLRAIACSVCKCRGWCRWLAGCCECR